MLHRNPCTSPVVGWSPIIEDALRHAFDGRTGDIFYDGRQHQLLVMWRGEQRALWPIRIQSGLSMPHVTIEATILAVHRHRRGAVGLLLGQLNAEPALPKLSMVNGVVTARDVLDLTHRSARVEHLGQQFEWFCSKVDTLYPTVAACAHPDRQDAHLILQGEFWQPVNPAAETASDSSCATRTLKG